MAGTRQALPDAATERLLTALKKVPEEGEPGPALLELRDALDEPSWAAPCEKPGKRGLPRSASLGTARRRIPRVQAPETRSEAKKAEPHVVWVGKSQLERAALELGEAPNPR